jgi:hypothetical protein
MNNMKLSTKLIGGFVIVAVIAAIIGGVGFWSLNMARTAQDEFASVFLPSINSLRTMDEAQTAISLAERVLCYEKTLKSSNVNIPIWTMHGNGSMKAGRFMNRCPGLRMKQSPGKSCSRNGTGGKNPTRMSFRWSKKGTWMRPAPPASERPGSFIRKTPNCWMKSSALT